MRKLKLDLNELQVESFEARADDGRGAGTVRGFGTSACSAAYLTGGCFTCNEEDTCGACANTSPRPDCASDGC